jgi:hypothetical protein
MDRSGYARRAMTVLSGMLLMAGSTAVTVAMGVAPATAGSVSGSASERSTHGDFNDDGYQDLAVGVPAENGSGAVHVIYGSHQGLNGDAPIDDQLWHENSGGIAGTPKAGDGFGTALAWGDFDRDGYADLAIAVPYKDVVVSSRTIADAGLVHVLYGSGSGLTDRDSRVFTQSSTGIFDEAQTGDLFGSSLTVATNFDGSPYADLAIGVPREDVGSVTDAGAVNVLYGSASGLTATGNEFWNQGSPGLGGLEAGDRFGSSLAAGMLGGPGHHDLAVGIPYEDVGSVTDAGGVHVIYGSASGLTEAGDQFWNQDTPGIGGGAELGDRFGASIAASNFGWSIHADLAIGAPRDDLAVSDAGVVNVIYGSWDGLVSSGSQLWHMDSSGISPAPASGDQLGFALAGANFGRSSHSDLAIGIPYDDPGDDGSNAGSVLVLYGSSNGLVSTQNQVWNQDTCNDTCIEGKSEGGDHFGYALAAANFGINPEADLAIGVPEESVEVTGGLDPPDRPGAVNVIYGHSSGLHVLWDQFWWQRSDTLRDSGESGDRFGAVLA